MCYHHQQPGRAIWATPAETPTPYFRCIKAGLLAHMQGYAPAVSIEFARKTLFSHERPSFLELEEAVAGREGD